MKGFDEYDELWDKDCEEDYEEEVREPQCYLDIDCEACNQKFCPLRTEDQW